MQRFSTWPGADRILERWAAQQKWPSAANSRPRWVINTQAIDIDAVQH
jgi:hypothetical protein